LTPKASVSSSINETNNKSPKMKVEADSSLGKLKANNSCSMSVVIAKKSTTKNKTTLSLPIGKETYSSPSLRVADL
jgi:hypothetical protein